MMEQIIKLFLSVLMFSVVNAQADDVTQDKKLNTDDEQSAMATLEQIVLQTVGHSTTIHPDPSGFLRSLPLKTQADFCALDCAMILAKDRLPEDIQKLENSLDKLGISNGIKYYFLYCFFRQICDERAGKISKYFLKKSAEAYFPQAIFEWTEYEVIVSKRCVENARQAARLLKEMPYNKEEAKRVELNLARLTLLYPDTCVTKMTVENAIAFVFINKNYISTWASNNNVFLEAAINCLVLNKEGEKLEKAIMFLTFFTHGTENDISSLIKLIYIFPRLNLNQPKFIELCGDRFHTLSLRNHCLISGGYISDNNLGDPKILDRINKSADKSQEFLKVALEAIEKSMQNKDLDLIEFFFGPKVEKAPEDILPVPVA